MTIARWRGGSEMKQGTEENIEKPKLRNKQIQITGSSMKTKCTGAVTIGIWTTKMGAIGFPRPALIQCS